MTWISWPTEARIKQHDGLWMYRLDGYPKSLEIGSFELVDRPDDASFWEWSNGSHRVTKDPRFFGCSAADIASLYPLVMFAPVDGEGRLVNIGHKPPPPPTLIPGRGQPG